MKNKYLVFDPGDGTEEFSTLEEAKKYAKSCIEFYSGWSDDMEQITISKVTHTCKQINRVNRPEKINEDGFDENGDYWRAGDEYKCNYEMLKL